MSGPIAAWIAPVRRRVWADDGAAALAVALGLSAIGWRLAGLWVGLAALIVVLAAAVVAIRHRAAGYGARWLVGALNGGRPDLEDSADLLFADPAGLRPVQRLQRERIAARVAVVPPTGLAPAWHARRNLLFWTGSVLAVLSALWWPGATRREGLARADEGGAALPGAPRLVGQRLTVEPPAYTGLPARALDTLDARVPQGSRLVWTLRFEPPPTDAAIVAPQGGRLVLRQAGADRVAARRADRSFLYRVVARGQAGTPPLHRIDVIADQPPRIRVLAPPRSLTMVTPGQRRWPLAFAVTDDHGVRPTAQLRLVLAQGEGENVSFRERVVIVSGTGGARERRFAANIDLTAAGFTEAGDLVAQLIVADNRVPAPQTVRGPSLILRRPPAALSESGIEASVRRVMPAYFRSQRQIIIDAEALVAARPRPAADAFLSRSDTIGTDQRLLRLRYGQFMGEETGGGATAAMPTNDEEEGHDEGEHTHAHADPAFGSAGDVTAEYGHTHDEAEAATLLDPGTRATLRQALDAMWQSELALRQGEPRRALPHAYRALRFIKAVQQATRIFLARTGTQLPPVDEGRRLSGRRDGIDRPALAALAAARGDPVPAAAWQALTGSGPVPIDALSRWTAANGARLADPLAMAAAIDAVRRTPGCGACRQRLRALLWTVLARPPAGVARRAAGDAAGRRYLEALR